jgi:DNA-binding winged helix-turn-helix (wHTH) protein/tetratricopeptide (TPR) repeat protein
MTLTTHSIYGFGSYQLDPVNRLLLRGGTRVPLKPKTFEMLLLLVEGRGDVLTKDQLMGTLWPNTFVEEANLTQHVATLRKTLGEGVTCRFIETVPKLGYRFVAPVEIVVNERPSATVSRPSLAVLPFSLFGVEATDSFLSLGIADTLITKLGQSARISMRSTSAVAKYEGKTEDAIQIGKLLDVDFVLTGRVYKQGELFRLNLQLVRVADESTLWTRQFDLTCANVFAVENSVLRKVERALLPAITGVQPKRKRQTRSGAAYRAYLKGRYFWNKRSGGNLRKGIDCFNQAIAIDENYALAYAGLADSYLMLINYGAMSSKEGFPLAKAATMKALEIDPDLGEAHASLGYIHAAFDWDWTASERELQRSIELNPADITPRHWHAVWFTIFGLWDRALEELQRAREIEPLSLILGAITGWTLAQMGLYDEARAELLKTLDLEPTYYPAHLYLARVCVMQGRPQEAITEFEKVLAELKGNVSVLAELAHTYARANRKTEALRLLSQLLDQSSLGAVPSYYLALVYAGLQDNDRAFDCLGQAADAKELQLGIWFRREPRFGSLREDVRYDALLKRMGLR